jgi:hypothetical protein
MLKQVQHDEAENAEHSAPEVRTPFVSSDAETRPSISLGTNELSRRHEPPKKKGRQDRSRRPTSLPGIS